MNSSVISDICTYLLNNLYSNISIDDIESTFNYNRYYVIREFKEYTGYTINEYINNCRIHNSVDDVLFTDNTILKIALNNGYNSQEYYCERFKDIIGLPPLRLRKIYNDSLNTKNSEELKYIKEIINTIYSNKNELLNLPKNVLQLRKRL